MARRRRRSRRTTTATFRICGACIPGSEIGAETPDLFAAAQKSLEFRGDEGTGWSRAWKINFWARLRDGDHALKVLNGLLTLSDSSKTK